MGGTALKCVERKPRKTPKEPAEKFCKDCWPYEGRNGYSTITNCVWDYATCYTACLRRNLQPAHNGKPA
jgi:hypothetical protein